MLKERLGAIWACASNQAQNAHFPHHHRHITQPLIMTMETLEEVSVRQEVMKESSIIDIKDMEGAIWACASIQGLIYHFSHQHHELAASEHDHGDVGGGEYAPGGGVGVAYCHTTWRPRRSLLRSGSKRWKLLKNTPLSPNCRLRK